MGKRVRVDEMQGLAHFLPDFSVFSGALACAAGLRRPLRSEERRLDEDGLREAETARGTGLVFDRRTLGGRRVSSYTTWASRCFLDSLLYRGVSEAP